MRSDSIHENDIAFYFASCGSSPRTVTTLTDTYPTLLLSGQADTRGLGYDGVFKARMILSENRIYLVVMTVHSIRANAIIGDAIDDVQ